YVLLRGLVRVVDLLTAINVCWLLVRFFVAVVPAVSAVALLYRFRRQPRVWWVGAFSCLVVGVAVQRYLVLPIEAFYLMGGFWAQVFALVPLFLLWLADALVRDRISRIAWLFALIAIYRYTYGLNLADLLI